MSEKVGTTWQPPLAGEDFQPQQPVYEAPDPTPTESDEAGNSCVNFLRVHKRIIIACLIIIIFLSFGVYWFLLAIRPTGNISTSIRTQILNGKKMRKVPVGGSTS